jgi:DNA-binding MarR family transcriptional regulator
VNVMTTTSALTAAKRELALRRRRNEVLGQELFGEPAWDMLLDLFVAHEEDRPLSVGRLCSAAGVPESTARRWLATLESHGTVVRTSDPADACSELVLLTAAERDRLVRFLGEGGG